MDAKDLELTRLRTRYLSTMVRILTNTIYEDGNINPKRPAQFIEDRRLEGRDWPAQAFTMIGTKRLDNVRALAEQALAEGIPGDFIETGVWRGGACIMMRAVLDAYGSRDRVVICADSFSGLPPPNAGAYPADAGDRHYTRPQLAISRSEVERAFGKFDLLDQQVVFLEGWFKDTLPTLKGRKFALIRLDGDMYESTMQALENLYPSLSSGGFAIIDDFGAVPGCKAAVEDYRAAQQIDAPFHQVDWTGVYWRKA